MIHLQDLFISKNNMLSSYLAEISWNFFFSTNELVEFNEKHIFLKFVKVTKSQKIN